jgi:hypothetical protein
MAQLVRLSSAISPAPPVTTMSTDAHLVDAALRAWQSGIERSDAFFRSLSDEQLRLPIAPGRNRLGYLWAHLIAVQDRMLPLLGIGERRHLELDAPYLTSPDSDATPLLSVAQLVPMWDEVNGALAAAMRRWTPADWVARHTAVSEADFANEPHRNRFSVLLSRTSHLASHQGQVVLVKPRA